MSMLKLAFLNFQSGFRNYASLILSLAFTIMIFLNFQNLLYSDILEGLGEGNADKVEIVVQAITFVLICFMFFFIWYASNVFLTSCKKEIGIYVFMGLSNQKIGKLYMMESVMTALSALVIGIVSGLLSTQLFQMILAAISEIDMELNFKFALTPIRITSFTSMFLYMIFIIKGYLNIVRSSVLELISANRQNEYVKQNSIVLLFKAVAGGVVLVSGYAFAIKDGGQEVIGNVLLAVILVVVGTYLLFGGLLPIIVQTIARNKHILYKKERNLWVNNVIFRMRKNYRTYAIVSVLMLCSITALASGFAMKNRYDNIMQFRNAYTYQFMSVRDDLENEIIETVQKQNEIAAVSKGEILVLDPAIVKTPFKSTYGFVSYSSLKQIAEDADMHFNLKEPDNDEIISVANMPLLSLTSNQGITVKINEKTYAQVDETTVPYLGYFQEITDFYMVNDDVYNALRPLGQNSYINNIRIKDKNKFQASVNDLETLQQRYKDEGMVLVKSDPQSNEIAWIKILYSVCVFMFMVFIMASGSILFMKLYNDAFEERERCSILRNIGISTRTIKKAVVNELRFAYGAPLLIMTISSWFSVHALAEMMKSELLDVNIISVVVIYIFFYLCYRLSIRFYMKNAAVK